MGRKVVEIERSPFKYAGDKELGIRPHEQCEMNEPDQKHQVSPTAWPPKRSRGQVDDPHLTLPCDLCGVNCIVYAEHATGGMDGIRVVLPQTKKP